MENRKHDIEGEVEVSAGNVLWGNGYCMVLGLRIKKFVGVRMRMRYQYYMNSLMASCHCCGPKD